MTKALIGFAVAGALMYGQALSAGKLLLASPQSRDADFAQSVILLVSHDRQGSIGLMVNRPLNISLTEVYPDMKGAELKLYAGGPLALGIRALYRSHAKPDQATPVFGDVSMIIKKPLLAKLVAAHTPSSVFRVYAGYVGWSGGQLQGEVARGVWQVVPGDAEPVFDPHPETLWARLTNHFKIRNILEKSSVQARKPVYGLRTCPAL